MDISELKRALIHDFFYIYTGSIFGTFVFCSIFYPDIKFGLSYFAWMALFSFAGDLTLLIFYSGKVLTERQFFIRTVIHFFVLETILMTFAGILGLYETLLEAVAFSFVIFGVYLIVKLMTFKSYSIEAEEINKRIRELNEKGEDF